MWRLGGGSCRMTLWGCDIGWKRRRRRTRSCSKLSVSDTIISDIISDTLSGTTPGITFQISLAVLIVQQALLV